MSKVFISRLKSNPPNTYQEVSTKTMQVHIAQPLDKYVQHLSFLAINNLGTLILNVHSANATSYEQMKTILIIA